MKWLIPKQQPLPSFTIMHYFCFSICCWPTFVGAFIQQCILGLVVCVCVCARTLAYVCVHVRVHSLLSSRIEVCLLIGNNIISTAIGDVLVVMMAGA